MQVGLAPPYRTKELIQDKSRLDELFMSQQLDTSEVLQHLWSRRRSRLERASKPFGAQRVASEANESQIRWPNKSASPIRVIYARSLARGSERLLGAAARLGRSLEARNSI